MLHIRFQVKKEPVELKAELTSSVVHASPEGQVGWFGVEFKESDEEIEGKLGALFKRLEAGKIN